MRHKIKEAISGFLLILIKLRITYDNSPYHIHVHAILIFIFSERAGDSNTY